MIHESKDQKSRDQDPHDRVRHNTKEHTLDADGIARITTMRYTIDISSHAVLDNVPKGREQSLALTKLEEALFWANAGIARNCVEVSEAKAD